MEKIKIYVSSRIADVLLKDAEGFEFFKKDGRTVNKNALLTRLTVNYHAKFAAEQDELFNFIKSRMPRLGVNGSALDELCFDLCEKLNERSAAPAGEKFDKPVSLKPTKESEPVIEYIERYSLCGRTLSEYFRSMFSSYAALPQDKREQIIFKPQYDAVLEAIKEKKRVFLTLGSEYGRKMEVAPYALATSKEEMHCYVLTAQKACAPLRLSRIVSVTKLAADASFTPQQIEIFEKMQKYGPQFIYKNGESEVLVELTARGIDKFKRLYVHRPVPDRVENNKYYFNCSHSQIVQYFVRFGEDAEIVYPGRVRDEIYDYHRRALDRYCEPQRDGQ